MPSADTVVILDFETTGLSPGVGDRAIEIGAVKIEHGQVTGRFQELMNPGQRINGFIESYTGITNAMLAARRLCQQASNHQLGTLVAYLNIPIEGTFHRAPYDSEMTTKIWLSMLDGMKQRYELPVIPFKLMQKLIRTPRHAVHGLLVGAGIQSTG